MRIFDGKTYRDMTPEEVSTMQAAEKRAELMERSRSLSEAEVTRMLITAQINTLAVDDNTALRMAEFYPEWAPSAAYPVGHKVQRSGKLWRCIQAHTSLTGWEPENAPSIWEQINESHAGTLEDPIPYSGNMALMEGLYYHQDYEVYRCTRDTVNPVYNSLSELVGLYVETV